MDLRQQSSLENLLSCFFLQGEEQFNFLKEEEGFRVIRGLAEYHNGRRIILPYTNKPLSDEFWAVICFEHENVQLEILYSHDNFALETYATFNHVDRFLLRDFMDAAKKPYKKIVGEKWVRSQDAMEKTMRNIRKSLEKNLKHLLNPDQKVLERARNMRSKRMQQYIFDQYKKDIKDASKSATKAFSMKNYRSVISLLTPYEADLSKADLKKLDLARKNIGDSI